MAIVSPLREFPAPRGERPGGQGGECYGVTAWKGWHVG